jgi:hypothetical protein
VPAVITAWLKRTGAASKLNYKVCSRTPSCPLSFYGVGYREGLGIDGEASSGWGCGLGRVESRQAGPVLL